jgi:DnaJ-class molecular chaperone
MQTVTTYQVADRYDIQLAMCARHAVSSAYMLGAMVKAAHAGECHDCAMGDLSYVDCTGCKGRGSVMRWSNVSGKEVRSPEHCGRCGGKGYVAHVS